MPPPRVETSRITLDETEERYLKNKGANTAKTYRSNLKRFKVFYPPGLVGLIKQIEKDTEANKTLSVYERNRPGENLLRGFITWHLENGYSNKSTLQGLATIQNALKFYGITISLAFIDTPPDQPMRENKKHEWTLDQIREYVEAAEYLRDKCYILFAFQSGLSIGDILDLNYGDIQQEFEAGVLPLAIEGYRKKTGARIRTFVGRDTVKYLRLYLSSRRNLNPMDPVFTMLGNDDKRATPVSIQKKLREYAEKLDFIPPGELENGYSPVRSHSLRSAFRSRLTGKMDSDLIECFMAHDIGQQRSTYINQPLDELREIYANYEHLLTVEKTSRDELVERGVPRVNEAAFNELAQRVGELAAENAQMKGAAEELQEQVEALSDTVRLLMERLEHEEQKHT